MDYHIFLVMAPFAVGVLIATGIVLGLKYHSPISKNLLFYFIMVIGYLLSNIIELLTVTQDGTRHAAMGGHFFFAFLPVIWLRFSILYVRNQKMKEPYKILPFCIIPVITIILMLTTNTHHLFWRHIDYIKMERMLTMDADYGPWMWIYGVYNDVLYISGVILLLQSTFGNKKLYQRQSLVIIAGVMFPLIFNLMYAMRLVPFLRKDFTSVSFTFTAVMCFFGISRLQLFRTVPIARNHIIQSMSTSFIAVDPENHIIDFNQSAEQLLSLAENDIGQHLFSVKSIKRFLEPVFYSEGDLCSEKQIAVDGKYYNVIRAPLSREGEHYEGSLYTIIDITEEVLLVKEKTALADDLNRANKELKKAYAVIIQQEKLATIGQLTAGIAHEINNPLSFVRSNFKTYNHYWELFNKAIFERDDTETPEITGELQKTKERMEMLLKDSEDGTNRVVKIIQDLLKFSRPVRNHDETLYDLNKGIESSLIMMGNQIKYTSGVEKDFGDIPKAECRENEINQVIINLLSNAVHAVKDRKEKGEQDYCPLITLKTWADSEFVFCSITNNGIDIQKKDLPHLFEPFYTTKKSGEGTGLGLAIAKDIIEGRYEGKLDIVINDKTSFVFSIPLKNKKRINRTESYDHDYTRKS